MTLKRLMDNPSSQRKINSPSSSSRGTQRKKMKRNGVKQISNGILVSVLSDANTKVLFIIRRSKSNSNVLFVRFVPNKSLNDYRMSSKVVEECGGNERQQVTVASTYRNLFEWE